MAYQVARRHMPDRLMRRSTGWRDGLSIWIGEKGKADPASGVVSTRCAVAAFLCGKWNIATCFGLSAHGRPRIKQDFTHEPRAFRKMSFVLLLRQVEVGVRIHSEGGRRRGADSLGALVRLRLCEELYRRRIDFRLGEDHLVRHRHLGGSGDYDAVADFVVLRLRPCRLFACRGATDDERDASRESDRSAYLPLARLARLCGDLCLGLVLGLGDLICYLSHFGFPFFVGFGLIHHRLVCVLGDKQIDECHHPNGRDESGDHAECEVYAAIAHSRITSRAVRRDGRPLRRFRRPPRS